MTNVAVVAAAVASDVIGDFDDATVAAADVVAVVAVVKSVDDEKMVA